MNFKNRIINACQLAVCVYIALYSLLASWFLPEFTSQLYDNARFFELIYLILLAIFVVIFPTCRQQTLHSLQLIPHSIRFGLGVFLLLALCSALNAQYPEEALKEVSLFILLFIFGGTCQFLSHLNKTRVDSLFTASVVFGTLLFDCHFIVNYLAAMTVNLPFSWITPFVSFSNVRFFNQYQAYTLPLLAIPLMAFKLPLRWRVVAMIILVLWWALHFATGSRSVWFALIVTALFLLSFLRKKTASNVISTEPKNIEQAYRWLAWQLLAMLIGGFVYWVFDYLSLDPTAHGLSSIAQRGLHDTGRIPLWKSAWTMIKSHPLLGIGPMNFGFNDFSMAAHPHNSVLQIAAEYGLPAALISIYLVITLLKKSVVWCKTSANSDDSQINISLTASLVCGLSDAMLSGNIIMPQSQMILFMVSGWLIGRNQSLVTTIRVAKLWQTLIFVVVVLMVVGIQLTGINKYYNYLENKQFSFTDYLTPRFWSNGHWPVEESK
ncbi:MAG: O-antigen ligase family protein [Methylococcales bacterium]